MPPWQPVRAAREAPPVRDGQAVLALPAGLRWVTAHDPDSYDPPRQFADVLLPPLGAALPWRHTHRFAPARTRSTEVTDDIATPPPARALRPMLAYRHQQLAADLRESARSVGRHSPVHLAPPGSRIGYGGTTARRRPIRSSGCLEQQA